MNQEELRKILANREENITKISVDALCRLCFGYDLYHQEYPESRWEGLSLYCFLLGANAHDKSMWQSWEEELNAEWKREKEKEEEEYE